MRKNRILAFLTFLPILIGAPAMSAAQQLLHWTPTNGPYQPLAGNVNFFEADGHLFGGGDQSTDDGLTWGLLYDKAINWQINGESLQVDSQGRLFGQFGTYFYFSSDTGITWSDSFPTPSGWTASNYTPIIDGRGRLLVQTYGGTLFWTLDFGKTWDSVITSPYPYFDLQRYDPMRGYYQVSLPDTLKVGSGDNLFAWPYGTPTAPYESYFYHSENLEATWKKITVDSGRRLILDPIYWFNDSSIWVATDSGLFMSKDSGDHFTFAGTGIRGTRIYLFQWFNDSSIWIATDSGLFTSNDRAQTFTFAGFSGNSILSIARGASNAAILVADENDSAFISHDDGRSWQSLPLGLDAVDFFTSSKGTLFLSNSNGAVWSSRDNGCTWKQDAQMRMQLSSFFVFDHSLWGAPLKDTMYFTSEDNGANWTRLSEPVTDLQFLKDGSMYGLIGSGNDTSSLILSTDQGKNWSFVHKDVNLFWQFFIWSGDTILAVKDTSIFVSKDRFVTWDTFTISLPGPQLPYGNCFETTAPVVMFQKAPSGTLWMWLCSNLIYTSNDLGKTINLVFDNGDDDDYVYNDPNGITYLPDREVGLLASHDNGLTWDTLPPTPGGIDLEQLLQVDSELFLLTNSSGVFRSSNGGLDWIPENLGIENLYFPSQYSYTHGASQMAHIGDTLFVSTNGGVYKSTVSAPSYVSIPIQSNDLMSIFPNPSGTSVTVSVTLQQPGPIELQLTDTKGTVLQRLSGLQSENAKDYIFNLSSLPEGVYFVSLSREGQPNITEKVVKH